MRSKEDIQKNLLRNEIKFTPTMGLTLLEVLEGEVVADVIQLAKPMLEYMYGEVDDSRVHLLRSGPCMITRRPRRSGDGIELDVEVMT
jgi:hypothetical protein